MVQSNDEAKEQKIYQNNDGTGAIALGVGGAAAVGIGALLFKKGKFGKAAKAAPTPKAPDKVELLGTGDLAKSVDESTVHTHVPNHSSKEAQDVVSNVRKQKEATVEESVENLKEKNTLVNRFRNSGEDVIDADYEEIKPEEISKQIQKNRDAEKPKPVETPKPVVELPAPPPPPISTKSLDDFLNTPPQEKPKGKRQQAREAREAKANNEKPVPTPEPVTETDVERRARLIREKDAEEKARYEADKARRIANSKYKANNVDELEQLIDGKQKEREKFDNMDKDMRERYRRYQETDPDTGYQYYADDKVYVDSIEKPGKEFQDNTYSHGFSAFGASQWIDDPHESVVNGLHNLNRLIKEKDSIQISASDGRENIGDFGVFVKGDVHANFKRDAASSMDPVGEGRRLVSEGTLDSLQVKDFNEFKEASSVFDNFGNKERQWTESILTPHEPIGIWYKDNSKLNDVHMEYLQNFAQQNNLPITRIRKEGNEVVYNPLG